MPSEFFLQDEQNATGMHADDNILSKSRLYLRSHSIPLCAEPFSVQLDSGNGNADSRANETVLPSILLGPIVLVVESEHTSLASLQRLLYSLEGCQDHAPTLFDLPKSTTASFRLDVNVVIGSRSHLSSTQYDWLLGQFNWTLGKVTVRHITSVTSSAHLWTHAWRPLDNYSSFSGAYEAPQPNWSFHQHVEAAYEAAGEIPSHGTSSSSFDEEESHNKVKAGSTSKAAPYFASVHSTESSRFHPLDAGPIKQVAVLLDGRTIVSPYMLMHAFSAVRFAQNLHPSVHLGSISLQHIATTTGNASSFSLSLLLDFIHHKNSATSAVLALAPPSFAALVEAKEWMDFVTWYEIKEKESSGSMQERWHENKNGAEKGRQVYPYLPTLTHPSVHAVPWIVSYMDQIRHIDASTNSTKAMSSPSHSYFIIEDNTCPSTDHNDCNWQSEDESIIQKSADTTINATDHPSLPWWLWFAKYSEIYDRLHLYISIGQASFAIFSCDDGLKAEPNVWEEHLALMILKAAESHQQDNFVEEFENSCNDTEEREEDEEEFENGKDDQWMNYDNDEGINQGNGDTKYNLNIAACTLVDRCSDPSCSISIDCIENGCGAGSDRSVTYKSGESIEISSTMHSHKSIADTDKKPSDSKFLWPSVPAVDWSGKPMVSCNVIKCPTGDDNTKWECKQSIWGADCVMLSSAPSSPAKKKEILNGNDASEDPDHVHWYSSNENLVRNDGSCQSKTGYDGEDDDDVSGSDSLSDQCQPQQPLFLPSPPGCIAASSLFIQVLLTTTTRLPHSLIPLSSEPSTSNDNVSLDSATSEAAVYESTSNLPNIENSTWKEHGDESSSASSAANASSSLLQSFEFLREDDEIVPFSPSILSELLPSLTQGTNKTIVLVTCNAGFVDFFENWLISIQRIQILNYIVVAEDLDAYVYLRSRHGPHVLLTPGALGDVASYSVTNTSKEDVSGGNQRKLNFSAHAFQYASRDYNLLVGRRPLYIRTILRLGYNLVYSGMLKLSVLKNAVYLL